MKPDMDETHLRMNSMYIANEFFKGRDQVSPTDFLGLSYQVYTFLTEDSLDEVQD